MFIKTFRLEIITKFWFEIKISNYVVCGNIQRLDKNCLFFVINSLHEINCLKNGHYLDFSILFIVSEVTAKLPNSFAPKLLIESLNLKSSCMGTTLETTIALHFNTSLGISTNFIQFY